jgi:hypothetical protein
VSSGSIFSVITTWGVIIFKAALLLEALDSNCNDLEKATSVIGISCWTSFS